MLIANELLDCLPARQFVRTERGWAERMVGADVDGGLLFGLSAAPEALIPAPLRSASLGSMVEVSTAQANLGRLVGERIARDGGAALFIDYGRAEPGVGDTLQALLKHQKVDVLASAGEADLTVHADFSAFAAAAEAAGAETTPIVTQRDFLRALGIETRASALMRAKPDQADALSRQLHRLIAPDEMGSLFKAVAIHSPGFPVPGFGG
jgi:SAM-dependent MidA family methyltransferase